MDRGRGSRDADLGGFRSDGRGQTLNDFAIGISLFLLATAFVFAFVPGMLAPFTDAGETGATIRAERAADTLVSDQHLMAGDPKSQQPTTLNATAVNRTFVECRSPDAHPDSVGFLRSTLGLKDVDQPNVTLRNLDGEALTATEYDVDEFAAGAGFRFGPSGTPLVFDGDPETDTEPPRCGPPVTDSDVAVWTRLVLIEETPYRLTVIIG